VPPSPGLTSEQPQDAFAAAETLRIRGKTEEATQAFADFVRRYPQDARTDNALLILGDLSALLKRYEQAQAYYRALLRDFPSSEHATAARFGLGVALYETRDYAASLTAIQEALKATPGGKYQVPGSYYQGAIAFAQQRYAAAVADLKVAAEASADPALAQQARALLATIVSQHLTLADLTTLVAQYPSGYPGDLLLERLALEYRNMDNPQEEAATLQRFVATFPRHPNTSAARERLQSLEGAKRRVDATKIGVILPLTGKGSRVGKQAQWGLQLALHVVQTRYPNLQLSLVLLDESEAAEDAQDVLRSLVEEAQVIGVIGPLFSQTARALAPLADQLAVPVITPYARDSDFPALGTYTFRNSLTDPMLGRFLAMYAIRALNRTRFAILYPDDAYGRALQEDFTKQVRQLRGEVVATSAYPPNTRDFLPHLRQLRNATYDVLFVPDYADTVARLAPYLAYDTLTGVQILGGDGWNAPELKAIKDGAVDGAVFADSFFAEAAAPQVQEFVTQFRSRYKEAPEIVAAQAYDTLLMCAEILKTGVTTRQQLRDRLLQVRDFSGVSGLTSMNAEGDAEKVLYLLTIRDRKIRQLEVSPGS
jgi:ABC-type branched-subunit amino acid transport system substrate-binding protein